MTDYLQQQFGDYRLVRMIGSGGFADVYEGEHLYIPGFKAAVKVLKGSFTPQQVGELGREAHILSNLDHPHIVRLHTFSIERSIPYLVMSYAQGGPLDKRHPRGTHLTLSEILSYVRPVAQALQYAHERRIVHRDLKPGNLLLTLDGRVQVADFGIAVVVNSGTTSRTIQEIIGTWTYMAPEQFEGLAEPASDQYSLAIMVYQWLCGQPPFTGNMSALMYQQINKLPPSLCERVQTLSPRIEQVMMRALAKKPGERFESVQAFVLALDGPQNDTNLYKHEVGLVRHELRAPLDSVVEAPQRLVLKSSTSPRPSCHTENRHNSRFCKGCGLPLNDEQSVQTQPASPSVLPKASAPQAGSTPARGVNSNSEFEDISQASAQSLTHQQMMEYHKRKWEQDQERKKRSTKVSAQTQAHEYSGLADEMEALVPNPKKIIHRIRGNASTPPPPVITSPWKVADTSLLHRPEALKLQKLGDDTTSLAYLIQDTLRSFRVDAEVREEDISIGPTLIRFGIRPTGKMVPVRDAANNIVYETRTRASRIMALQNDLALVLEAKTIRMEAPVPGRSYVGVEIPNKNSRLVTLREILESKEYLAAKNKSKLALALGRDVAGQVRVGDLVKMPHVLIAGATGSGKSVMINTIIACFLTQATPDDVRMLMVDPKMVELSTYDGIPHLLSPVVTEVDKVVPLLKNAISEMERRYRLFSQLGVRNLDGYRKMRLEKFAKGDNSLNNLPSIVIIIDELADLMMAAPEEVEGMICHLAQLAHATGIHLVIATQRSSVDVITGLIKSKIPTRISFMVNSAVDSRTIIDMGGAERLLGRGDMLYLPADAGRPERIQAAFLADEEAQALVEFWRQQATEFASAVIKDRGDPKAAENDFELDNDLLEKAEEVVLQEGKASISLLQRRLRIGYSRAARLIDLLEERGIIG